MPETNPPRARWAYDETLVLADGREIAVRSIGDVIVVLRIADRDDVALAPHEARQIASLLRNGTELDHIPHRSCDEALEAARTERDRLIDCGQDAALGCAEAPGCLRCFGNEVAKAQQERDAARVREREHVTRAQDVADEMRRKRDAAIAERDALQKAIDQKDDALVFKRLVGVIAERDRLRAQVTDLLPEADAKQHFATRALRAEERLQRLRRELEALRDDLRGDADDSRAGMDHDHAKELDDIARSIDAILRGES